VSLIILKSNFEYVFVSNQHALVTCYKLMCYLTSYFAYKVAIRRGQCITACERISGCNSAKLFPDGTMIFLSVLSTWTALALTVMCIFNVGFMHAHISGEHRT
jgi:hypothetical protein